MHHVEELLDCLAHVNINGVKCTQNFLGQRIQPYKERSHPAYEYQDVDFVREAPEPLNNEEINRQVSRFFTIKKSQEKRHPQLAFGLMFPPPEVIVFGWCYSIHHLVLYACQLIVYLPNRTRRYMSPMFQMEPGQQLKTGSRGHEALLTSWQR